MHTNEKTDAHSRRENDMIQVKFRNLDKSEMAREAVQERVEGLVLKFDDLSKSKIQVTLERKISG